MDAGEESVLIKKRVMQPANFPLASDAPSRALVLRFEGAPIDATMSRDGLVVQRAYYAATATRIVDLFNSHLPGGLTDAIFAELAHRQASVLRVANAGRGRRR